jgi:hypothetical protein
MIKSKLMEMHKPTGKEKLLIISVIVKPSKAGRHITITNSKIYEFKFRF